VNFDAKKGSEFAVRVIAIRSSLRDSIALNII